MTAPGRRQSRVRLWTRFPTEATRRYPWSRSRDYRPDVDDVRYLWRNEVSDDQIRKLVVSAGGGSSDIGWWDRVRPHSLGWVTATATAPEGRLVGFANVAWDGGAHAFLLDPTTHPAYQRSGIGSAVVALAAREAARAGCEWMHVDFEAPLRRFYFDACGFKATDAGLIHLGPPL